MLKAVVFDLDNTLVSCNLDFKLLRKELACPDDKDLLEHVASSSEDAKRRALNDIILRHEIEDARSSTLMKGAHKLLKWMEEKHLYSGVITRNCRQAAETKLKSNNIEVHELITREDFPAKPNPASLLFLIEKWQLTSEQVIYVGDHEYDIKTGENAGCLSCFISNGNVTSPNMTEATYTFTSLGELHQYLVKTL
ncbi:HAD family hydrolase [Vibrio mediterranei]